MVSLSMDILYAILCCAVLYVLCCVYCAVCSVLCCAVLYCMCYAVCTVLCCAVVWCGDLLYTVFHCTICTACTVLCYAVLYYTIVRLLRVLRPIVEFNCKGVILTILGHHEFKIVKQIYDFSAKLKPHLIYFVRHGTYHSFLSWYDLPRVHRSREECVDSI